MAENNYLTEEQVDRQEHLSRKRLELLNPKENWSIGANRPQANLIDLMHWVKFEFAYKEFIKNNKVGNLHCWIHNKIVIDGAFLEFAEQEGVKIECLYRDSIASWKSDNDNEHFMAQGIFKISYKKLQFIHAALFHKGNQNEDEVSFFVIMHDDNYEKYIELRNKFDDWLTERDRNNLEIHVVGADSIPYEKDMMWDDLFLPQNVKNDIVGCIDGFFAAKELYEKRRIPWKKGLLFFGDPGGGKTTCIRTIISNYDFKPVTVMTSQQTNDEIITNAFEYAQEQGPALLYFEDLDVLLGGGSVSMSHFLNLMDGVNSRDGIMVIATANNPASLGQAVLRPSRFDRKWEFPLPTEDLATKYLKKWYGDTISAKNLSFIVKNAVERKFSYAYLKELYITSAYHALSEGRNDPQLKDIKKAMKQLLSDKENVESDFISENQTSIGIE